MFNASVATHSASDAVRNLTDPAIANQHKHGGVKTQLKAKISHGLWQILSSVQIVGSQ
jgi:hypothetical protein